MIKRVQYKINKYKFLQPSSSVFGILTFAQRWDIRIRACAFEATNLPTAVVSNFHTNTFVHARVWNTRIINLCKDRR